LALQFSIKLNKSMNYSQALLKQAVEAAPLLLGAVLERNVDGQLLKAKIVEVEAYDETDAASHSYKGITKRTEVIFGEPGRLYVYFTYGMHYCCNVVVGHIGSGSAVLIRAVEPLEGIEDMLLRRHGKTGIELTNGPAKVCQALGIDMSLNGHSLFQPPLQLMLNDTISNDLIVQTTRIGISKAKDALWRFYIKGSPYVSK
jgi:DNA-3-methyladenine glycosylase